MNIPLVIIAGPTGIGKTRIAIEIAEQLNGEIVGADSMQIYRFMDIGTAKPTPEERTRIPHYLIDVRNPDQEYSAAEYVNDATVAIRDISRRGKLPLLVGGTGLYIEKLLYGIFEGPGRDDEFRQHMRAFAQAKGNMAVHQQLQIVDPQAAARLHPNDLVRVIRALEVFHLTGVSISVQQAEAAKPPAALYDTCFLVLNAAREQLYERINTRAELMITNGLVDEVKDLYQQGYSQELHPLKSLGYKEIGKFLAGEYDLSSAVTLIKRNTRRYAKRQLTWFRKYPLASWITRKLTDTDDDSVNTCLRIIGETHSRMNFSCDPP